MNQQGNLNPPVSFSILQKPGSVEQSTAQSQPDRQEKTASDAAEEDGQVVEEHAETELSESERADLLPAADNSSATHQ
jgi:hypothetical protein